MSYTITSAGETRTAEGRTDAVRVLRELGENVYGAVRLLDVADGLRQPSGAERDVTVTRAAPARPVVDFYLDGSPVYESEEV